MEHTDHERLLRFIKDVGWKRDRMGSRGAVWKKGDAILRIPYGVDRNSFEWSGLIERAAVADGVDPATLQQRLENWLVDMTEMRAVGGASGSIALEQGITLVTSARSILRTSATTSRTPRAQLGYQYSAVGDRITRKARMGHTRPGSYVIPILMPVEPADEDPDDRQESLDGTAAYVEPEERRATRTMAQALDSIQQRVIGPAREPAAGDVSAMVVAGVARETVVAIRNLLKHEVSLGVQFEWAAGLEGGNRLPSEMQFPSEAEELLDLTAKKLRTHRRSKAERLTGYIVQMRREPQASFRLQTVRSGRECEVEVDIPPARLEEALQWFADRESLLVQGNVERRPGHSLRVPRPELMVPLRDLKLDL
ncbi:MAG: hypothetical protein JJU45_15185 [Acidimicrobiia bacterium]|nr:hypothetical protein [Acidimicrobiia bacterium]